VKYQEAIVEALRDAGKEGISTAEIKAATGASISYINRYINEMKASGVAIAYVYRRTTEGHRVYIRPFHVLGRTKNGSKLKPFDNYETTRRYRQRIKAHSLNSVFNLGLSVRKAHAAVVHGMTPSNSRSFD